MYIEMQQIILILFKVIPYGQPSQLIDVMTMCFRMQIFAELLHVHSLVLSGPGPGPDTQPQPYGKTVIKFSRLNSILTSERPMRSVDSGPVICDNCL